MKNSTVPNPYEHTTDWAFNVFRPLLKSLEIQRLKTHTYRLASKFTPFLRYNMAKCAVVVVRIHFSKQGDKGVFLWRYDPNEDFSVLYIILNNNLYDSPAASAGIKRKLITTHEYVHCAATMMSLARMTDRTLIRRFNARMQETVHYIQLEDVDEMMRVLMGSNKSPSFNEQHFKTNYEDFVGSYLELFSRLLFSRPLFEEYFTKEKRKEFSTLILHRQFAAARKLFDEIKEQVATEKNIDPKLIDQTLEPDLLNQYVRDALVSAAK